MDVHNARGLYVQRSWELDLLEGSVEFLRGEQSLGRGSADVFVEAGANIGMICIAMLRRDYFREAIAIEPDPVNFELLERNVRQNGLSGRIRTVRCALSDNHGEAELELSGSNYGDHRVRVESGQVSLMGEEGRHTLRVPVRTLDEVLAASSVEPEQVGLVWIDVQGHEGRLLRGASRTLAGMSPVLAEFWPYGILRSGMDRDSYATLIRSLFDRMVIVDAAARRFEPQDLSQIEELFDRTAGPDQYLELLLYPRRGLQE
jgi:FkbM family methyltransferase